MSCKGIAFFFFFPLLFAILLSNLILQSLAPSLVSFVDNDQVIQKLEDAGHTGQLHFVFRFLSCFLL